MDFVLLDEKLCSLVGLHVIRPINDVEQNKSRRKHTSGDLVDTRYTVHVHCVCATADL